MSLASNTPIGALRAALAGRWSPLGAVIAAILGTGYLVGLAGLVLLVSARPPSGPAPRVVTIAVTIAGNNVSLPGVVARAADAAALEVLLLRSGAALEWTGEDPLAVPAVFLDKLPANMTTLQSTAQRKRLFIGAVLPLVLAVNDRIERVRTRVVALHKQQRSARALGPAETKWLARTATAFKTKPEHLDQLLVRADTVPVPIALAQAAIESGWGTSRFAREGNALFGQWTWQRGGGLVPERRETGADHSVRSFPRLIDSVIAYIHNLNTHRAYAKFRKARTALRDAGGASAAGGLNPMIEGLSPYSTRGPAYVKEINALIRQNRLSGLGDAHLVEPAQRLAERNAR